MVQGKNALVIVYFLVFSENYGDQSQRDLDQRLAKTEKYQKYL